MGVFVLCYAHSQVLLHNMATSKDIHLVHVKAFIANKNLSVVLSLVPPIQI
jgi:hypothetical protein